MSVSSRWRRWELPGVYSHKGNPFPRAPLSPSQLNWSPSKALAPVPSYWSKDFNAYIWRGTNVQYNRVFLWDSPGPFLQLLKILNSCNLHSWTWRKHGGMMATLYLKCHLEWGGKSPWIHLSVPFSAFRSFPLQSLMRSLSAPSC